MITRQGLSRASRAPGHRLCRGVVPGRQYSVRCMAWSRMKSATGSDVRARMPPVAEAGRTERFAEYVRGLSLAGPAEYVRGLSQAGHVTGTAHP